jgi:hypothetical protein
VLYAGGPGTVIRCRTCAGVLVVITGCGAGTAST